MFSFYKLVEALDQLHEEIGGDVGIPNSSGVSASGAINPPENPAKGKKKELLLSPVKPEEIAKVQEVSKWQKMSSKLSPKAAVKLLPLSTEKGIKLVKRMIQKPEHAHGLAARLRKLWIK